MIQQQTILKVADNSGARLVKCIKILNQKTKTAITGDLVVVSIKKLQHLSTLKKTIKLKKREVCKAIVVSTKFPLKRANGFFKILNKNSVILVDNQLNPIGTRITGLLPKDLKKKNSKLGVIAKNLV